MADVKRWEAGDSWVEIDMDLCTGIGECVDSCPMDVYRVVDGRVVAEDIGECNECAMCDGACPNGAILRHFAW